MPLTERYASVAGGGAHDGTSEANAWTLAEAVTNEAAGQRINVKAGTYASTTTTRTLAATGTTTAPILWRGYNSTPGDLDNDPATAKPLFSFTTGRLVVSGAHHILSNLSITSAFTTGGALSSTGAFARYQRCRIQNTNAAAASRAAVLTTGTAPQFIACYLAATSSATSVIQAATIASLLGCTVDGGGHGLDTVSPNTVVVKGCLFRNNGGDGINVASGTISNLIVEGCTFHGCGSDGVEFTLLPSSIGLIADCLFANCGGYGIHNSTGTNTNVVHRSNNAFYSNTSGNENGFGDSPSFSEVLESSGPFANAGGGDYSLVLGALSRAAGLPGPFEAQSYASFLDIGAVQRQEPAGGGFWFEG